MARRGTTVGVLGAGAQATALAVASAKTGSKVVFWPENAKLAAEIRKKKTNPRHLPGVKFPASIQIVDTAAAAVREMPVLLLATARADVRRVLQEIAPELTGDQILIHTVSGVATEQGGIKRTSEMVREECCVKKIGCLAGPDRPMELASAHPTGMVIASLFHEVVDAARAALGGSHLSLFETGDLTGVELANALTDAYAISAGLLDGLKFGTHTMAYLLTRSLVEMASVGGSLGADPATFSGLAGIGRLYSAATGDDSPFPELGRRLVRSRKPAEPIRSLPETADAVDTVGACATYVRKNRIPAPLLLALQDILTGRRSAAAAVKHLTEARPGSDAPVVIRSDAASPQPLAPPGGSGKN